MYVPRITGIFPELLFLRTNTRRQGNNPFSTKSSVKVQIQEGSPAYRWDLEILNCNWSLENRSVSLGKITLLEGRRMIFHPHLAPSPPQTLPYLGPTPRSPGFPILSALDTIHAVWSEGACPLASTQTLQHFIELSDEFWAQKQALHLLKWNMSFVLLIRQSNFHPWLVSG